MGYDGKSVRQIQRNIVFMFVFMILSAGNEAQAAARIASVSGNWNNTATWGGAAVPTASDNITINAGITVTMNVAGSCTVITSMGNGASIIGSSTLTLQAAATITVAAGATATISCPIAGAANSLTISGNSTGTLTLSADNTFTGWFWIKDGTVSVPRLANLGAASPIGAATGGNGPIYLGNAPSTGTLQYTGTGHTTNRGISMDSGGDGIIDQSGASGLLKFTGAVAPEAGGGPFVYTLTLRGSAGGTGELGGVISNGTQTLAIVKAGTGTWTLSGTNTYTGGSTLTSGTLVVRNTAGLGAAGQAIALNGGTLDLSTDATVNAWNTTVGGTVTIESDRATSGAGITHVLGTLSIGAQTLTVNKGTNVASGTAAVSFGNLTLTGAATFNTGTANILMTGSETGNFKLTKSGAGTLQKTTAGWTLANAFEITAGTYDANGQTTTVTGLATVSGGEYKANTASQTFNGGLTISGGTFTGLSGTAGNVTTTGLTLSSGTLSAPGSTGTFNVSGDFSNSGTFTHNSGTVTLNGAAQAIGGSSVTTFNSLTLNGTGAKTAGKDINVSGTLTVNQPLTMSGANVLTMQSTASQPTFASLNEITGSMTWQAYSAAAYTFNNAQTIVTFTGADGARTFTVKSLPNTYPSFATMVAGHSVNRDFNVSYSGWSTGTATLRLAYLQGEASTLGVTESRLRDFQVDFALGNSLTGVPTRSTSGPAAFGYLSYAGLSSATLAVGEIGLDDRFGTFKSIASAAWNVATTWDQNDVPSTWDYAIVDNSNTVTIPDAYTASALKVTINATTTGLTVGAGASGVLNVGTGGLTSNSTSGAGLVAGNGSTINIAGDWTNNGTAFTPGTGTVVFNGSGAQSINGTTATKTYNNLTVNKSGGTLSAGGSTTTMTLNGSLTLTAGTFAAGTATTINIALDWTNNGGTFTPGGGTVVFNGSGAQNINGTTATKTYNNLIVNKLGGTVTAGGSTTTMTLNGSLTLTAGTFAAGTATTINVAGDWTNNSGAAAFTAGTGTVVFNGSTQTIGGSAKTAFKSLTLGGTGAKTANAGVDVSGALTVNQPLAMSGANVLTMLNGASQPTFSGLTEITGTMTWQAYTAAAYTFNNAQTIVTFTGADGARTFTVKSIPNTYPSFGTVLAGHTVKRNFNVSYSGWNTGTATLRLAYLQSEGSTLGVTESRLAEYDGDIAVGNRLPGLPTRSASGPAAFGYVSHPGLTSATIPAGELALDDRFGDTFRSIAAAAWNVATTWDQNAVPSTLDNVIVDNNWPVTVPDGYTGEALSVIINATATGLTVGAGASGVLNIGTGGLTNSNTGTGLTVSPNAIVTITSGTLSSSGSITNNGTLTVGTAISGTGSLTQGVNSTLNIGGTCTITTITASTNPNAINYNGTSGAQVIGANLFTGNTISNLTINNAAGVTLQGTLNVTGIVTATSGNLATGGFLTLVSSASQTALINGSGTGNVTGNVTMQRYLPIGYGYKYFSSPFQAATVNEFGDDMNLGAAFATFYKYDETRDTTGWVNYVAPAGVLNPLEGYAVNFGPNLPPNTVDVTGVVNNGVLSRTVYNNNKTYTKGFNLAGNPYPSAIDWDAGAGWTKTNIDNALYYFRASTTDQYGGVYSSYAGGVSSDGVANNIIPSMQGFFIHVTDGAYPVTGTLGVTNSVRINDQTHPFLKSEKLNSDFLVRLAVSFNDDSLSSDPMVVYFNDKAKTGFDSDLDALKLMNTDKSVPNIYSLLPGNKKLSINALPAISDKDVPVPIGIKSYRDGEISIGIKNAQNIPVGFNIYLYDKTVGIYHDLLADKAYQISLSSGDYSYRFSLMFLNNTPGIPEENRLSSIFNVYPSNGILKANVDSLCNGEGTVYLFDLLGHKVLTRRVYEKGYYEFDPMVNTGIYIVSFVTGNVRQTKKIFILKK